MYRRVLDTDVSSIALHDNSQAYNEAVAEREKEMTPLFLGQSLWSHLFATCAVLLLLMSFAWVVTMLVRSYGNQDED